VTVFGLGHWHGAGVKVPIVRVVLPVAGFLDVVHVVIVVVVLLLNNTRTAAAGRVGVVLANLKTVGLQALLLLVEPTSKRGGVTSVVVQKDHVGCRQSTGVTWRRSVAAVATAPVTGSARPEAFGCQLSIQPWFELVIQHGCVQVRLDPFVGEGKGRRHV
jgi:hypothetical protein